MSELSLLSAFLGWRKTRLSGVGKWMIPHDFAVELYRGRRALTRVSSTIHPTEGPAIRSNLLFAVHR
jgi:hypothetical protein